MLLYSALLQASHGYFYDALHALVRVFEKIIDLGLWEEPEVSDCRRTSQSWISGPEIVDYIKTVNRNTIHIFLKRFHVSAILNYFHGIVGNISNIAH